MAYQIQDENHVSAQLTLAKVSEGISVNALLRSGFANRCTLLSLDTHKAILPPCFYACLTFEHPIHLDH